MDIKVLIPITQGTEEMEAVVTADLLRRAGFQVKIAGENEITTCSGGLKIIPDLIIDKIQDDFLFDAIVLPGGTQGSANLSKNESLIRILKLHIENNKLICAICAAPLILLNNKLLLEKSRLTSHASVKDLFTEYNYLEDSVVVDKNLITSRGAGTSIEFALMIINELAGKEIAGKVANNIHYLKR